MEICAIDTTLSPDLKRVRSAETRIYEILEREIRSYGLPGLRLEHVPIDPRIAEHPFFSHLYYTQTPDRPEGAGVEECYAGRSNLLVLIEGEDGGTPGVNQAINAHIDVVAPYFPPRVEGDVIYGRGACDDKGNVVAMLGALKLLGEHLRATGRRLNRHLTGMIVIDEEMGGNGSLSLAMDRKLKERYDSLLVLECADSGLYPGNRGCVWYKIEGELLGANLFEASFFIVEELEKEGRAIRAESDHPLFPHRPVQTCHGIIGHSGEHPSRINGDVSFEIRFAEAGRARDAAKLLRDVLEDGLAQYVGLYGDKTRVNDPLTGRPKVDHHYDLAETDGGFRVRVWGATGHMGSIFENDGAITKMASMGRALLRSRKALEATAGGAMSLSLAGWDDSSKLLMEGGQGFLPTHRMEDVQTRMREAAWRGLETYLRLAGAPGEARRALHVTYDKLHNAAFAGAADSPDMRNAIEAAKLAGMYREGPIRGWDVSCDARIFACEYPGLPVITTGPGMLRYAHSDSEQIDMRDVVRACEFIAYYVLRQTGTV